MLILTRRCGERLRIGENISVVALGYKGKQIRLGINAPVEVPIYREEIYQRIKQEGRSGRVLQVSDNNLENKPNDNNKSTCESHAPESLFTQPDKQRRSLWVRYALARYDQYVICKHCGRIGVWDRTNIIWLSVDSDETRRVQAEATNWNQKISKGLS